MQNNDNTKNNYAQVATISIALKVLARMIARQHALRATHAGEHFAVESINTGESEENPEEDE